VLYPNRITSSKDNFPKYFESSLHDDIARATKASLEEFNKSQQVVSQAEFKEVPIPEVGSLVRLPGDRLAFLNRIQSGMIIGNEKSGEIQLEHTQYPHVGTCPSQHPIELSGNVDVTVVVTNGKLHDPADVERFSMPICRLRVANTFEIDMYKNLAKAKETMQNEEINNLITRIETSLNSVSSNSSVSAIQIALSTILNDHSTLSALCAHHNQSEHPLDSETQRKITHINSNIGRFKRLIAIEQRT
jgi:hypothetical protein